MVSYVVTGTSRGIGLGWVCVLASDSNNKVFAIVRNKRRAAQLLEFIVSEDNKHKNVTILEADLDNYKSLKAAAGAVSKVTGGTLDILINNGALLYHERSMLTLDTYPDEETLENDLTAFFKTNVIGVTHTINAFLPLLRAGKTKRVLVVSSSMGSPRFALDHDVRYAAPYSISKAALNVVVAKYATKYKNEEFVFLGVSPGLVKTMPGPADVVDKFFENIVAEFREKNPNFPGPISSEESAALQLELLNRVTAADTGAFLHQNGKDANFIDH